MVISNILLISNANYQNVIIIIRLLDHRFLSSIQKFNSKSSSFISVYTYETENNILKNSDFDKGGYYWENFFNEKCYTKQNALTAQEREKIIKNYQANCDNWTGSQMM